MNQQMRNKNEELKKAIWKLTPVGNYMCGKCGNEPYYSGFINKYKFCPFCGQRMRKYEMDKYTPERVIETYDM